MLVDFSWTVLLQSYLYFIVITQQNEHEKTTMTTQNEHYNKIIRNITQTKLALVTLSQTHSTCMQTAVHTLHYNVWIFRLDFLKPWLCPQSMQKSKK